MTAFSASELERLGREFRTDEAGERRPGRIEHLTPEQRAAFLDESEPELDYDEDGHLRTFSTPERRERAERFVYGDEGNATAANLILGGFVLMALGFAAAWMRDWATLDRGLCLAFFSLVAGGTAYALALVIQHRRIPVYEAPPEIDPLLTPEACEPRLVPFRAVVEPEVHASP